MLSEKEQARFRELSELKKKQKLGKEEFAEWKKLKGKCENKPKSSEKIKFDPGNDFTWWSKFPELIRDSASFKSNYIAGRFIDATRVPYIVPGVMEVRLCTCYLAGSQPTDPVNVWARNLYLKMFQKYRPASSYSASDLGIAILAGMEAVKLIALYERIYGIINRYSLLNVNMPDVEARALGLSSTQVQYLQTHLSDFRYDLNYLIKKSQRLCIPKDISFISDIISLLGYEYVDHNNPRGQIILFTLENYGIYSDTALTTGGEIQYDPTLLVDYFDFSADNMCYALDRVLNALLGSDSIQRIYADLVVWFGADAMLQFLPMPEDYTIVPVESESILHKLHNLEHMPAPATASTGAPAAKTLTSWAMGGLSTADETVVLNGYYHVYQYMDSIVTTGVVKDTNTGTPTVVIVNGVTGKALAGTNNVYGMGTAHLIDGYKVDVTPEFIVEGSLLKYVSKPISDSDKHACVILSNVNWLVSSMFLYSSNGTFTAVDNWNTTYGAPEIAGKLALVDWAPLSYTISYSGTDVNITSIYGDLDVIVPVSAGDLHRVHTTCFMSGIATDQPIVG